MNEDIQEQSQAIRDSSNKIEQAAATALNCYLYAREVFLVAYMAETGHSLKDVAWVDYNLSGLENGLGCSLKKKE